MEPDFDDWPVADGRSVVWLARHMLRHDIIPTGIVEICIQEKGLPMKDQAIHELRHLAGVLEYGGC